MRAPALALVFVLASSAFADRIFFIPTGRKLFAGNANLEYDRTPGTDSDYAWLTYGFTRTWEFQLNGQKLNGGDWKTGVDASYTFTYPLTDTAPGISVGALDLNNDTDPGRAVYAAITYRIGNDGLLNQFLPTDLTFGFWSRKEGLLFAGAELPFSDTLEAVAEFNGRQITAGFDITPIKGAKARLMFLDGRPTYGLQLNLHF